MPILIIIGFIALLSGAYLLVLRPWHLRWGASDSEVNMTLPGDNLVANPDFNATRAISIQSTPEDIWKWIIQIGSKRAGWYSIDWMDNAGIQSSFELIPEYQSIEAGQFIPFTPDQKNGMWVKEFKEHEYILWTDKEGKATWLWYLYVIENGATRMLTRLRTKYVWKGIWIIYYIIYDFGDIIMMTRCMKGIKKRAEQMK